MNLFDRSKQIAHGAESIAEWLGSGGVVVDRDTAQARADVCLKCPMNEPRIIVTDLIAKAIRRHLEVKNKLELRVQGEKQLHTCAACGCVLRLLIWEEQSRIKSQMTPEETEKTPTHCWKLQ